MATTLRWIDPYSPNHSQDIFESDSSIFQLVLYSTRMSNCHYIDFVIERTVHQLALNKQLLEGHPTSELAKWR